MRIRAQDLFDSSDSFPIQGIMDSLPDAIVIVDAAGQIVFMNAGQQGGRAYAT